MSSGDENQETRAVQNGHSKTDILHHQHLNICNDRAATLCNIQLEYKII